MKRTISVVAGSLFAVLAAGGGFTQKLAAQAGSGATFSVPFPFTADGYNVAAGTYEVRHLSSPFLISVINVETGEKQIFSVRPEQQGKIPSKGLLVFHRCGERVNLTEFHMTGTNSYSTAISPKRARNSEVESCSPEETMTVAAR